MILLNYCFHASHGLSTLAKRFYCLCLNTQESDVQKLQDKLNCGQIEEVIVQVKRRNL